MTEADRGRLDYVVLPRRGPGLALLERYFPSPADNQLDAELTAFAEPGDIVLDPWAGTGWTARRAAARGLRAIAADPSPFAHLAAVAFLGTTDLARLDAAFERVASSRQLGGTLREHVDALYTTQCPACRHQVVGEQFIWPRDSQAPGRKIYRCTSCELALGDAIERVAPVDEGDLTRLGLGPAAGGQPAVAVEAEDELPAAPVGLIVPADDPATRAAPDSPPLPVMEGHRRGAHYDDLRQRFPVLDRRTELVDELLALYTPRNLYALHSIATAIDAELDDQPWAAASLRLALAGCLLPGSRLNGYPGRVASLRIAGGHVRQPASRHQRELNVWRLFEASYRDVRTALAAATVDREALFAEDFSELADADRGDVLWIRCRPAVVGEFLPSERVDLVLGAPPPPATIDELSFEYLATAWLIGRDAAETLRLEPLFGGSSRADGAEATAMRHALAAASDALKPGGWCNLLVEGDDPDRVVSIALAAAAAGLDLVDVIHRESTVGPGTTLHLRRAVDHAASGDDTDVRPLKLGADGEQLTYPELAEAVERAARRLLSQRGEPATLGRMMAAVVEELADSGLLRRIAATRFGAADGETPDARMERGPHLVANLVREQLWRTEHPALVRIGDVQRPMWWLREPQISDRPLADRVEWATWSILSTSRGLDEAAFLDRIFRQFPGLDAPDEELVRACLAAYADAAGSGVLRIEDDLPRRSEDHAEVLARLAEYGHRLGLKVWLARTEHEKTVDGVALRHRLRDDERRAYLPLVLRAPTDALAAVDAMWYLRGRAVYLFDVDWTGMLGDAVLRRGRAIPAGDRQARFFVFPAQRTALVRLKLERSPWLRDEMERQNWHLLKWQHLEALSARPGADLERLEPLLGLDPLVERGGEQLTMFGE